MMNPRVWITASFALAVVTHPSVARADSVRLDLGGGVNVELVTVPATTFDQGSAAGAPLHAADENARRVTLSKSFLVGRTLVTVGQWKRFVADTSYRSEAEVGKSGGNGWTGDKLAQRPEFDWNNPGFPQTDANPVVLVTFADANAFTRWMSGVVHRTVRLPTEAEWEAAAKGNTSTPFFWGDAANEIEKWAWFGKNADHRAHPVGEKPANPLGLVDAVGNVWQWTSDGYGEITPAPATDPRVDVPRAWAHSDKPRRVLKGGSWNTNDRGKLRPAARHGATDGSRNADYGFRVVVDLAQPAQTPATTPPSPTTDRAAPPTPPKPRPPPAPPKPAAPKPVSAVSSFPWLVVVAGGGLAIIFAIILAARRKPVAKQPPPKRPTRKQQLAPGSPYRARLAPDGFWLEAPDAQPGETVSYVARVKGKKVRGSARVSGSSKGTFVYTGEQPASVDFPMAVGASSSFSEPLQSSTSYSHDSSSSTSYSHDTSSAHSHDTSSSDSSGGSGWPSAY